MPADQSFELQHYAGSPGNRERFGQPTPQETAPRCNSRSATVYEPIALDSARFQARSRSGHSQILFTAQRDQNLGSTIPEPWAGANLKDP